jgi:hypothetical protein
VRQRDGGVRHRTPVHDGLDQRDEPTAPGSTTIPPTTTSITSTPPTTTTTALPGRGATVLSEADNHRTVVVPRDQTIALRLHNTY